MKNLIFLKAKNERFILSNLSDETFFLQYFQREIRERYENDHELLFVVANKVTLNAKKMKKLVCL